MRHPSPQQAQRPGAMRTDALACAALLVVVAALFGRVLGFPFLDWDDVTFIVNNPSVSHPQSVSAADLFFTPHLLNQYRPLPVLHFFWLQGPDLLL